MNYIRFTLLLLLSHTASAQQGTLTGALTSADNPVPFGYCTIEELNRGVMADDAGMFALYNLPEGKFTLITNRLGFLTDVREVTITENDTLEIVIELKESPFDINTVVVSGTRTDRRRINNPVAVNVLNRQTFEVTQSNTLSEGLCYQPGLRVETDCQTCNYTQLRMNGLGGSYNQILIDNRPVFTSLMSLYSLEQIPSSQIEKVEVVRGGGSALYGSSAIAGTVNIITRMPERNDYSISNNSSWIDGEAFDNMLNGHVTLVNEEKSTGLSLFASNRARQEYDANGDGYSEMPRIKNNSFGLKLELHPTEHHELKLNGWSIYEFRRGGDAFDLPADRASQSEERTHNILIGGIEHIYTQNERYSFNTYLSAQQTRRRHYTGIDQSDGWGNTRSETITGGWQFNRHFPLLNKPNTLSIGLEHQYDNTFDEIAAYNYLIDQQTHLTGLFLQNDWKIDEKLTLLPGLRINKHNLVDQLITTPRLSALYLPRENLQIRGAYARGFKAPQAFESDMHIAFSAGGVALVNIDPGLHEETSDSYSFSMDYNHFGTNRVLGFTINTFFTNLYNTFVLEETGTDGNGNIRLLRTNGGNSTVKGVTLEGRINYNQKVQLETGFTFQSSDFEKPVAWSAEIPGTTDFLRTPDRYGFYTLSILPENAFSIALSGVYTGPMKVPHFAGAPGVEKDELTISPDFLETNLKLTHRLHIHAIETDLELSAGVQNLFNAYQSDFDTGKNRDSNYIYGPSRPRTYFVGLKMSMPQEE